MKHIRFLGIPIIIALTTWIFVIPSAFAIPPTNECDPSCFDNNYITIHQRIFTPGWNKHQDKKARPTPTNSPKPAIDWELCGHGLDCTEIFLRDEHWHPVYDPIAEKVKELWQHLPLKKPMLYIQPPRKTALINIPVIAFTAPVDQTWNVVIASHDIIVRSHTVGYSWSWGDGITTYSKDPGKPWPDQTVSHIYYTPGNYTITVTAHVTATYRMSTDPPEPIPGSAKVTSTPHHLQLVEKHAVLISPRN